VHNLVLYFSPLISFLLLFSISPFTPITLHMPSRSRSNTHPRATIIYSNDPHHLRSALSDKQTASFLILRRPPSAGRLPSGYYIDYVHVHRGVLERLQYLTTVPATRNQWFHYHGLYWPHDLSILPGPWRSPLSFSFHRLTILDLDLHDAVYWLIPILNAVRPTAPLRRVILRGCDDHDSHPLPFPFADFDTCLMAWPAAKVLLGWAFIEDAPFIAEWHQHLPTLASTNRIAILYSGGPNCLYSSISTFPFIPHFLFHSSSPSPRLRPGGFRSRVNG
jgi:hypothetical protein